MTRLEQLSVHIELVWLARYLDLPRKEAAATREVLKRVTGMIVAAREESRRGAADRRNGSARQSVSLSGPGALQAQQEAAAVGLGLGMAVSTPSAHVAVRRKESTEGNASMMAMFERMAHVMGIDLLSATTSDSLSTPQATKGDEPGPAFGWPELQVEYMKEGLAMAEALPDHLAVVRLATSALHRLHRYLNPQSQGMLGRMYPKALATVRRRGIGEGGVGWWMPGKIVLAMEVAGLASNRMPVEHAPSELAAQGKKDPFLYNPRLKAAQAGKVRLVLFDLITL